VKNKKQYDYIIAGAGAAGLSLAIHMLDAGILLNKSMLIIDRSTKSKNDRTWCFWETKKGVFEDCVSYKWDQVIFKSSTVKKTLKISPYTYKMIAGIDFYNYCINKIKKHANIEFIQEEIIEINDTGFVKTKEHRFESSYIFNSAIFKIPKENNKHYLLQHFHGWFIETESDVFDPSIATLMDFSIEQNNECQFVYVLPHSKRRALVEHTFFSEKLLALNEYEQTLKNYIKNDLNISHYKIIETEYGVIPMTNANLPSYKEGKVLNIGTAGGATKASSGYTFIFIQEQCKQIVEGLKQRKPIQNLLSKKNNRFKFYDSVFLRVLSEKKMPAAEVFTQMFTKLPPDLPLKFLNESTMVSEELRIISVFNKIVFTKAALKELF